MAINEKYSFKDFMNQKFTDVDAKEFNNSVIVGSCFYQECPFDDTEVAKDIWPTGMTGVTFRKCNLDNVLIPPGNTVEPDCTNKKIKVQNDLEDWVLDAQDKPLEPISKANFIELGISIDPKDIPKQKKIKSIIREKDEELMLLENP